MAVSVIAEKVELRSIADRVEIAPGVMMPRLGVGTWGARGSDVQKEVQLAVEMGYRLIDTSANYLNEKDIGDQLMHVRAPREELFVTTKLEKSDFGYSPTILALEASLDRLGLDHVDLYIIHWPGPGFCCDTWRAMEELVKSGWTRSIGVSNFKPEHLDRIYDTARIPPAINQIEFHPYRQQPDTVAACRRRGITVQAWGPVMRGHADEVPELVEIANRHDKTPSQVCIRWILQKGFSTIPKSIHAERLKEDADVFDFELNGNETALIDSLDRDEHISL